MTALSITLVLATVSVGMRVGLVAVDSAWAVLACELLADCV
jgi:hypothetical protein